jgi:hypothetical protein
MAELGYPSLSWDQLIEMRSQGVGPDYVTRPARTAGYAHLTPEQLVSAALPGVSPDFVRGMAAEGLKDLSLSELLELRTQGVSPEYVRNLRAPVTPTSPSPTSSVRAPNGVARRTRWPCAPWATRT